MLTGNVTVWKLEIHWYMLYLIGLQYREKGWNILIMQSMYSLRLATEPPSINPSNHGFTLIQTVKGVSLALFLLGIECCMSLPWFHLFACNKATPYLAWKWSCFRHPKILRGAMLSFWLAEQGLSISNNIRSLYHNLNFPENTGHSFIVYAGVRDLFSYSMSH